MSKLLKGAVLGGLGKGLNNYMAWKDENARFKEITAIQDRRAQEDRDFRSDENRIARQARGEFLPGEDGIEEYEKMFARRLKIKEASKAKNPQFSMPFAINGGADLVGVPQSVTKPPPPLDPTKFTENEFQNMTDNILIDYVGRVFDALRLEDNSMSAQDVYAHLERTNPNVVREVRALVMRKYNGRVEELQAKAGEKRVSMPYSITSNSLFSRSPSFAQLADVPLLQHVNSPEVTPEAVKNYKDNWKISTSAENVASRAMGSVGAHIIAGKGTTISPIVQKLQTDRFVAFQQKVASGEINTTEGFYAEMRNLLGGNPTEQQMDEAFIAATTYNQPYAVMTGIVGNRQMGDVNPSFRISKGTSDRAKLNQRNSEELASATASLASIASRGNVQITATNKSWQRGISEWIVKVGEGISFVTGGAIDLTKDRTLNALDSDITGEDTASSVRDNAFNDLESTLRSIADSGTVEGLTSEGIENKIKQIRKFEESMRNAAVDNETYLYNFQRIKLAYLYAKFIQGGGGGNAVSNADFDRNFDALFGVYSTNKDIVLADSLKGLASINNDAGRSLVDARYTEKYTAVLGGQERTFLSPDSQTLLRLKARSTQRKLDQAGYREVAAYWIAKLHDGDAREASPLLQAMLISDGQEDLQANLRRLRQHTLDTTTETSSTGDDTTVRELVAGGATIDPEQQKALADSLSGKGGSN